MRARDDETATTGPDHDRQSAARNALIRNPLELIHAPHARRGPIWSRFGSAGTRHIGRDAGVTSNSVAFSASSMSAVVIASVKPSQPQPAADAPRP
jgi:hypothetical protein